MATKTIDMTRRLIDSTGQLADYLRETGRASADGAADYAERIRALCALPAGSTVYVVGRVAVLPRTDRSGQSVSVPLTLREVVARPVWQGPRGGYWGGRFADLYPWVIAHYTAAVVVAENHPLYPAGKGGPATLWFDFDRVEIKPTHPVWDGDLGEVLFDAACPR